MFSIKPARSWDWELDKRSIEAKRHADVYVFCLLKHNDKQTVNPLALDQWDFYVLSTDQLNNQAKSINSISLKGLQILTSAVAYCDLKQEIIDKYNSK